MSPSLHPYLQHRPVGVKFHPSQRCQLWAQTKLQTGKLGDGGGYKKPTRFVGLCFQHGLRVNR